MLGDAWWLLIHICFLFHFCIDLTFLFYEQHFLCLPPKKALVLGTPPPRGLQVQGAEPRPGQLHAQEFILRK